VSNNSIYGVMLLHGFTNSDVLDILNLSSNQHTTVNILTEVELCVSQSCVKWSAIKCCVTDSPSTMTKFRRIPHDKRPHTVMLLSMCLTYWQKMCVDTFMLSVL
jgi:hypothetical protein